jgi:hypothetical protein
LNVIVKYRQVDNLKNFFGVGTPAFSGINKYLHFETEISASVEDPYFD